MTCLRLSVMAMLAFLLAGPALAGDCTQELQDVRSAAAAKDLSDAARDQVDRLLNEGAELCAKGQNQKAIAKFDEVKILIRQS